MTALKLMIRKPLIAAALVAAAAGVPAAGQTSMPGQTPLGDPYGLNAGQSSQGGQQGPPAAGGVGSPFWQGGNGGQPNGGQGGSGGSATPFYPAEQVDRVAPAYAAVQQLQWTLKTAEGDLYRRVRQAEDRFARDAGLDEAQRREREAWRAYQDARGAVLDELADDPAYAANRRLARRLGHQIERLHEDGVTGEPIAALARQRLGYVRELTKAEADALAGDTAVDSARRRHREAGDEVSELRQEFARFVQDDPELENLRRAIRQLTIDYLAAQEYANALAYTANVALNFNARTQYVARYRPITFPGYGYGGFGGYGGLGGFGFGGLGGYYGGVYGTGLGIGSTTLGTGLVTP